MSQTDGIDSKRREYFRLLHAMQTGVAHVIEAGLSEDHKPKHLRVGLNSAMVDYSALVTLLVAKGLITWDELYAAMVEAMRTEVSSYEKQLSDNFGTEITLA
jgi:hypothetical protein